MNQRAFRRLSRKMGGALRNLRSFRFNSILLRYFLMIAALVLVPMYAVAAICNANYQTTIRDEIADTNTMTLRRSADMLENVVEQLYGASYNLSTRTEVQWLLTQDKTSAQGRQVVSELWSEISFYKKTFEYLDSIYVYFADDGLVLADGALKPLAELTDRNWLPTYQTMAQNSYTICSRKKNDFFPYYLTMICPVHPYGNQVAGAVIFNINMKQLGMLLGDSPNPARQLFMTDSSRNLYYASNYEIVETRTTMPDYMNEVMNLGDNFSGAMLVNGEKSVVSCISSQRYDWKYIYVSALSVYEDHLNRTNGLFARISVFALLIGLVVAYILTLKSYEPIRVIMNEVDAAPLATEDLTGQPRSQNEVEYITNLVHRTQNENSRMKLELEERMQKLNQAQVRALQNQINPHFLYNTLDTANWLAIDRMGTHNLVSKLITTLGNLLRTGLQHGSHLVPLREELEHAKLYVHILELCYPDKLLIHWDIDPELLDHAVVTFCYQPLLENAMSHGLKNKRGQGNLWISAERMGENGIRLAVADDGRGMTDAQLAEQNARLTELNWDTGRHVGLSNVNQRARILFGDQYGVQLRSLPEGGLVVEINLPLQ